MTSRARQLSNVGARRIILRAQGFGSRPAKPTRAHVHRVTRRIGAIRIDSINVLVRAHYLAPFSRLGAYPADALDTLAYNRHVLFEGATRGTSLIPVELYPLFRYRMVAAQATPALGPRGEQLSETYLEHVYDDVASRGPLMAHELLEPGETRGKWWGWRDGKIALEHLLSRGRLAVAGRENFKRLYDIVERVIPRDVLETSPPDPKESIKQLMVLAAESLGIALAREIVWYFNAPSTMTRMPWKRYLAELVEDGRLERVEVEDWPEPGYLVPGTRVPGGPVAVRALLSPFDPMMTVADVAFDFWQPLAQQLYVPAHRRIFGYYVVPFVLGDAFVGRCDLKADRNGSKLLVQGSFIEQGHDARHVASELASELHALRSWLDLDKIEVADSGDLAPLLRKAVAPRGRR